MLDAALLSQVASQKSYFEVYARTLPPQRSYGVLAGTARIAEAVKSYRFSKNQIDYLKSTSVLHEKTLAFLANFSFTGSIWGYLDGDLYFPNSPVLRVEGTFAETLILETLILSILNFDTAIASAASRMVQVGGSKALIEMGTRRTNDRAAVLAARAAYIAGFSATSNLQAGFEFSVPTSGTVGHALILAHQSEREAFHAQYETYGTETTALVDTYDIETGIRTAIEVFGTKLRSIRIDSGDLKDEVTRARRILDDLGATSTQIILSGDLDEYSISDLSKLKVDGFGVGTRLVGGSGYPSANFVYKLVAIENNSEVRYVAKTSSQKESIGGPKDAIRFYANDGILVKEHTFDPYNVPAPLGRVDRVQKELIRAGTVTLEPLDIKELRRRHLESIEVLPISTRQELQPEGPYLVASPWIESSSKKQD